MAATKAKGDRKSVVDPSLYPLVKDWDKIIWDEFHILYPKVTNVSFYRIKASGRTPLPTIPTKVSINPTNMELSAAMAEEILEYIRLGHEAGMAAEAAGIPIATFQAWTEAAPENKVLLKKAISVAKMRLEGEALTNIKNWGQRNWTSSAWLLERLFPETYAKKDYALKPTVSVGISLKVRGDVAMENPKITAEYTDITPKDSPSLAPSGAEAQEIAGPNDNDNDNANGFPIPSNDNQNAVAMPLEGPKNDNASQNALTDASRVVEAPGRPGDEINDVILSITNNNPITTDNNTGSPSAEAQGKPKLRFTFDD